MSIPFRKLLRFFFLIYGFASCIASCCPAFSQTPEALGVLRGLENTRATEEPFLLRGTVKRERAGSIWNCNFTVEYSAGRYRIAKIGPGGSVAIWDGNQMLLYDGEGSAVIAAPDKRLGYALAFDPRSLGLSTGLYCDLTLEENIAYHSGTDIKISVPKISSIRSLKQIELTDRFSQKIRFDVEAIKPFRVHYYSKTIVSSTGEGIFTRYVTESEFWPELPDEWIPRKIVMYVEKGGDSSRRSDEVFVEFEKADRSVNFGPETWTAEGLSLPFGEALSDLRTQERIGYWNGKDIVEDLPARQFEAINATKQTRPRSNVIFIVINLLALLAIGAALFWSKFFGK